MLRRDVSIPAHTHRSQPCAEDVDGAMLRVAMRRKRAAYPELAQVGPQRLLVLGSEVRTRGPWPQSRTRQSQIGSCLMAMVPGKGRALPESGRTLSICGNPQSISCDEHVIGEAELSVALET